MKKTLTILPAVLLVAACANDGTNKGAETDHAATGHEGHVMGAATPAAPLTEAQAAYKAASDTMHEGMADIPADPDVAFMQGMLAHHRGAVAMSQVALKYAKDEQARDLARRVIAAQEAEIAEMDAWLRKRQGS